MGWAAARRYAKTRPFDTAVGERVALAALHPRLFALHVRGKGDWVSWGPGQPIPKFVFVLGVQAAQLFTRNRATLSAVALGGIRRPQLVHLLGWQQLREGR